jgi:RHS repeat-associated protein
LLERIRHHSDLRSQRHSPDGSKLAVMSGQSLQKAFIALPGGATAVYNSSGLAYYRHPDWLGSSRIASTPDNQVYASQSYAPFGEAYVEAGRTDRSFAGHDEDTVAGIYDAPFRKYSPYQGRWISPDPGGLSVVDPTNPQSWNRYAYVLNSPINLIDPLGLWCTWTITFSADGENATNTLMCGDDRGGRVGAGNHGNTPMLPGDLGGEAGGGGGGGGGNPANNGTPQQQQCLAKVQGAVNAALGTQTAYLGPTAGISDPNLGPGARGGAFNFNFFAPGYSIGPISAGVIPGANCGRFDSTGSGSLHIPVPGAGCNPNGDPTISPWGNVNGGFQFTAHIDSANPYQDLVGFFKHIINDVIRKVPHGC